ncbi:conserved hypothetical protein [[Clostridium] ultunense Esp]|nr:conserved hypothetical protein [[Clostridium] ultunense Esp]
MVDILMHEDQLDERGEPMTQANIPNITPSVSITVGQTIPLLLSSIALEELALAHIMNAEAEKLQFVLGTLTPTTSTLTPAEVTISNLLFVDQSVRRTLEDVIKKEMLLQFKFDNILDLIQLANLSDRRDIKGQLEK